MSVALFTNHNTVIQWVKRVGEQLSNAPENITDTRLHRKTFCYSLVQGNAALLNSLTPTLLTVVAHSSPQLSHLLIMQRRSYMSTPTLVLDRICLSALCEFSIFISI